MPVHRDMYTRRAHAGRHACVLTCIVHKSRTPECKLSTRDRGGEIRGETWAPTPVDSKETWNPFFNKPTLHVSGTLSQLVHSAAYPKQHESRRILISTAWVTLCHIGFAEVRFARCVMSGHRGSVNTTEMASENVRTR